MQGNITIYAIAGKMSISARMPNAAAARRKFSGERAQRNISFSPRRVDMREGLIAVERGGRIAVRPGYKANLRG